LFDIKSLKSLLDFAMALINAELFNCPIWDKTVNERAVI